MKKPGWLWEQLLKLRKSSAAVRRKAEELGLWLYERELLACPKCGLHEELTSEGGLIVTKPGARKTDTGLRFRANARTQRAHCPACGKSLKWEERDWKKRARDERFG